jgi:hypothetical protein
LVAVKEALENPMELLWITILKKSVRTIVLFNNKNLFSFLNDFFFISANTDNDCNNPQLLFLSSKHQRQ